MFVIAIATSGCAPASRGPDIDAAAVEREVGAFFDFYRAAVEAADTALLRTMYVDDGRFQWVEDGQVRYDSPGDVIAALAGLAGGSRVETAYPDSEVTPLVDGAATVSTRFVTSIGEGPAAFEFGGMITLVVERGPAGWRIVTGHTSTSRPDGR